MSGSKPVQKVFKRQEKKYLLSYSRFNELYERLLTGMKPDAYGESTVRSIYYDNEEHELIMKSIDKPIYKEKFRVRCYGAADDETTAFAEIKKKYDGIVYKRRVTAPCGRLMAFINDGEPLDDSPQIQREIRYMLSRYDLKPSVYIAYDRLALAGKEDPELRVTFDYNTRFRTDRLDLRLGDDARILQEGLYIMEMKLPGSAPLWLTQILSEMKIRPGTFSKYGECYKRYIIPELRREKTC